jgi:hypothetical protein
MNPSHSTADVPPQLLTKRDLARYLGVTPRTVETYQRHGPPFFRLGSRRNRYDLAAVRRWLEIQNPAS